MRDVQRLRQLSSTTALGLWAEDAILALDRVARLGERDTEDLRLLEDAADVLDAAVEQSEEPLVVPAPAPSALAAADTALDVAEDLAENSSPEKTQAMLREVAGVLRRVTENQLGDRPTDETEPAIDFFSAIGRHQLAAGNSVSARNRGVASWMADRQTLSFS